jgi:hypothetical protein
MVLWRKKDNDFQADSIRFRADQSNDGNAILPAEGRIGGQEEATMVRRTGHSWREKEESLPRFLEKTQMDLQFPQSEDC